jgi:hypothetical protein
MLLYSSSFPRTVRAHVDLGAVRLELDAPVVRDVVAGPAAEHEVEVVRLLELDVADEVVLEQEPVPALDEEVEAVRVADDVVGRLLRRVVRCPHRRHEERRAQHRPREPPHSRHATPSHPQAGRTPLSTEPPRLKRLQPQKKRRRGTRRTHAAFPARPSSPSVTPLDVDSPRAKRAAERSEPGESLTAALPR